MSETTAQARARVADILGTEPKDDAGWNVLARAILDTDPTLQVILHRSNGVA